MGNQSASESRISDLLSSLPAKRVLRVVRDHQRLLDEVHQDARRIAIEGPPTAYVVDFDLLYSYMWSHQSANPTAAVETAYLLEHGDHFIIGPGTLHELERSLEALLGESLYASSRLDTDEISVEAVEVFLGEMERRLQRILDKSSGAEGIARLNGLLREGRLVSYSKLASVIDLVSFDDALKHLRKHRGGAENRLRNVADALNYGAVAHLRAVGRGIDNPIFPYLLTGTRVVLDIPSPYDNDNSDETTALTRSTRTAIYGCLLLARLEPQQAAEYTVRKAFDLARVAHDLQTMPEYYKATRADDLVTQDQVKGLAGVLDDEIIGDTQQVLDNLLLTQGATVENQKAQGPTVRYLLDQVIQLARLLEIGQTDDDMWHMAYDLDKVIQGEDSNTVRLYTKASDDERRQWVFECAHYFSAAADTGGPCFIFRWPSRLDAPRACRVFSQAFIKHDVDRCRLYIGTEDQGAAVDEVDVPIDWHNIAEAVSTSPRWMRASSDAFDLYADLWAPLGRAALFGVFVENPDPTHIARVFQQSCSKYLFPGWARALSGKR